MMRPLFGRESVRFTAIDPLGGGLAEAIAAEQSESDAIVLEETIDGHLLSEQWSMINEEATKAEWFVLADEDSTE